MRKLGIVVATAVAILSLAAPLSSGFGELGISVVDEVEVGQTVELSLIGLANRTFNITIDGPADDVSWSSDFPPSGIYTASIPPLGEGTYFITLQSGNESVTKTIKVTCLGTCQAARLASSIAKIDSRMVMWFIALVILGAMFEGVRFLELVRDKYILANAVGLPDPSLHMWKRIRQMRVVLPASFGSRRVESNPRTAHSVSKRKILDEIHKRSSPGSIPLGRDDDYEFSLYQLFKAYVVEDTHVAESLETLSQDGGEIATVKKLPINETGGWKALVLNHGKRLAPPPPDDEEVTVNG